MELSQALALMFLALLSLTTPSRQQDYVARGREMAGAEDDADYGNARRMQADDDYMRMEGDDDDFARRLKMEGSDDDFARREGDDDFARRFQMEGDDDDFKLMESSDDDFEIVRGEQDDDYRRVSGEDKVRAQTQKAKLLLSELASLQKEAHTKPPLQRQQERQREMRPHVADLSAPPTTPGFVTRGRAIFEDTDVEALARRIVSEQAPDDNSGSDGTESGRESLELERLVMVSAQGYEHVASRDEADRIMQGLERYVRTEGESMMMSDSAYSSNEGASRVEAFINATSQRVIGRDQRIKISRTNYYPWSAMAKIDNGCSGTFIGPTHVLTAGHCVYNPYTRKWNRNLNVRRAKNCNPNTGFLYTWKNAVTVRGWMNGRRNYDYGVIVVSRMSYTWMSFGYRIPMPRLRINMAGYPVDKPGQCMWYSYCNIFRASSRMMTYDCDTNYGMSGTGVYSFWRRQRVVYGIHVGSTWRRNVGILINKARFRTLLYIRRRFN